jgi:hypothetical protein
MLESVGVVIPSVKDLFPLLRLNAASPVKEMRYNIAVLEFDYPFTPRRASNSHPHRHRELLPRAPLVLRQHQRLAQPRLQLRPAQRLLRLITRCPIPT